MIYDIWDFIKYILYNMLYTYMDIVCYVHIWIYIYIMYIISYIWVNNNNLTSRPKPGIVGVAIPK